MHQEITQLLVKWSKGDDAALDELIPLVYPELRRIARRYMRRENSNDTLQTSALINEAYLRLVNQRSVDWQHRAHFFAVSAQVMRHVLIDNARKHRCDKRGGGTDHFALDETAIAVREKAAEFIALDGALERLSKLDRRKSQVVEFRFFGGLTVEETAEVLGLSPITIKREWRAARAWLLRELEGEIS